LTDVKGKTSTSISPSKKASNVIDAARKYLGTPYKYSGTDKHGIDCSGLMCRSFGEIGITLPHQSEEQSRLGKPVKINELQPGDLVFIGASKGSNKITHVGLVVSVGNGKVIFIHASTKKGVIEENLLEKWYQPLFIKGVRLF
jgi:cell wall-associated NlpC family hydrolase